MLLRQLRDHGISNLRANEYVVKGCDDIEYGARVELADEALSFHAHVVRRRARVDDGMVPQPAAMCATVAEVDERPYAVCESGFGYAEASRDGIRQCSLRAALDALRQRPE